MKELYRVSRVAGCLSLVGVLIFTTSEAASQNRIILDYPEQDVPLAIGWHLYWGVVADAFCVEHAAPKPPAVLAQEVRLSRTEFRTQESLWRKSTYSQDIGVNILATITGKSSSVYEYSEGSEFKSVALSAQVMNTPEQVQPAANGEVKLKKQYADLLRSTGILGFRKVCGDGFVTSRAGGAEMRAITTLNNITLEESSNTQLSFAGGITLNSLGVNLSNADLSESRRKEIRESLSFKYELIGGSASAGSTSTAGVETLVATLPQLAASAPKFWSMEVRPYESLSNFPPEIDATPNKRSPTGIAWRQYLRLNDILRAVRKYRSNPSAYIPPTYKETRLAEIEVDATARLRRLKTQIDECVAGKRDCSELPQVDEPWDYEYRSDFPVPRGFTTLSRELEDARARLRAAYAELDKLWPNRCKADSEGYAPSPEGTRIWKICHEVLPGILATVNRLEPQEAEDAIAAAHAAHVIAVRNERCEQDATGPLCSADIRRRFIVNIPAIL